MREHPTLTAAQNLLMSGDTEALQGEALASLRDAVARAAKPLQRYRCAACAFEAQHYFWQCPGCLNWDTYPPQRLEDQ
jgi:lipopolysaccharide biosynthesis regulator YciM